MKRNRAEKRFNDRIKKEKRIDLINSKFNSIGMLFEDKKEHWFLSKITFSDNFKKTKNKGKRRRRNKNYAPSYNPSKKDKIRLNFMSDDVLDYKKEFTEEFGE